MSALREQIGGARRIVVKVGSSSLTTAAGGLDAARLDAVVDAVAGRVLVGGSVVVVSSGAIAAGLAPLGLRRRPCDLATQQAAASVGQQQLAAEYARSFGRFHLSVGQVLLTSDDVVRRAHYRNAQRTFATLLSYRVVPVVNENDTVATAEIKFGDNDRLAALVAHIVGADALVLLSDVDALYTAAPSVPGALPIRDVGDPAVLEQVALGPSGSDVGTGGMTSKLAATQMAIGAGIPVLLASAADAVAALHSVPTVGTAFAAAATRTQARSFWLLHAANSAGAVVLDDGAVQAIRRRKSLLPAGIVAVRGSFDAGDVVDLLDSEDVVIARGFVSHDAQELAGILGRSLGQVPAELRRVVAHADDIALAEPGRS